MKKEGEMKFFIITLIIFSFCASVKAQTAEQLKFEIAAQNQFKYTDTILQDLKDSIDVFFQTLPEDNIISGKEMKDLRTKVQVFDLEKSQLNEKLKPYRMVLWTEVNSIYRTNAQNIKKYWIKETGRDIQIETINTKPSVRDYIFLGTFGAAAVFMLWGFF